MDLTIIAAKNETGIPKHLNFRSFQDFAFLRPSRNLFSRHYVGKQLNVERLNIERLNVERT